MVREARVRLRGRTSRYLEAGSGWPVLLVHAFPLNAEMWRAVLERVPAGWRYIAPDLRGFGPEGVAPDGAVNMSDYAADMVALLDVLEIDLATIGGLSMGGYVVFAMLRAAAERFTGIILADTRPQADAAGALEGRRRMLGIARDGGPTAVAEDMLPKLIGDTTRRERPDIAERIQGIAAMNPAGGVAAAIEAMMRRSDSTDLLARTERPALVVVGEEDTLTPRSDAEAMQRLLPRSRLVEIPAVGHLSALEDPEAFAAAVADFVTSNM